MNLKTLHFLLAMLISSMMMSQNMSQITIPFTEFRAMLGVGPTENFALVYKGDTLASQTTHGDVAKSKFFDEHITRINFGDSVEFHYSLPHKSGLYRLRLPDSTKLFSKELVC